MTVKSNLILLLIGLVALGCLEHPNKTAINKVELKEFGETGFYNKYLRPKQKSLGLSDLRSGFDSLQLRVWWHFSFSDSADVFVIKKESNGDWLSERMRFPLNLDSNKFGFRTITSNNGKRLWEILDELDIKEYNGMDSLTMRRYSDGEIAIIEIATKSTYRFCSSQSSLAYTSGKESYEVVKMTAYLKCLFTGIEFPEETARRTMMEYRK